MSERDTPSRDEQPPEDTGHRASGEIEHTAASDSDGHVYRLEAEVESEDCAKILRNTVDRLADCTLTAFDQIEVDDV